MTDYVLSGCSTADLTREAFEKRRIACQFFHYEIGGEHYPDDLGHSVPFPEFYRRMERGDMTRTSQPNAEEYRVYFESFLKEGKDVLHVTLSSGISGALNAATSAAAELREAYPERKLYVIDSLGASSGYGLLLDKLADLRDEGMDIDSLKAFAEENRLNVHHWFFSTDLRYYVRGGRISKTSGFVGGVLGICPLLNMDDEGRLVPREKIRGKKRVIQAIARKMQEHALNGADYDGKCFISCSACEEDARAVADLVEDAFPKLRGKVQIFSIGTVIGSHTGPGTVALFFWGDKRGK